LEIVRRLLRLLLDHRSLVTLWLKVLDPSLDLQACSTLLLQLLHYSLVLVLQAPPFFLQAFGLLLGCKALLSFCLEVFYQLLALLPQPL
jgi:hypothetical protein